MRETHVSLFLIFVKNFNMKKIFLLLSASFLLMACPKETIDPPIYDQDYGKGLYILTENGVNFYDFDEDTLKEDIYSTVNGNYLQNPSSLNIYGNKMYIVTQNTFHKVDAETFLSEFSIGGFTDAQQCEYAKFNRFYVTDKGESEIKVVDLVIRDISGHVKTGDNVYPTDIVVNWGRAFVVNSGGDDFETNSGQLNHPYLPWESGWSGEVDQAGGKKLTLRATKTEKVNGIDCLVINATPINGFWTTRWLARDKKGTVRIMRETRNGQTTDLMQPFLPSVPEAGWKSWTDASAIPENYSVVSNASSKIRLQSGKILENCIRLIVHSPEGTCIEYYSKEKGLVRIEKP